jgi:hypothetical protein
VTIKPSLDPTGALAIKPPHENVFARARGVARDMGRVEVFPTRECHLIE